MDGSGVNGVGYSSVTRFVITVFEGGHMHQLDIADDTFVRASLASVCAAVRERARWQVWWPDLILTVTEDRGSKGIRWYVDGAVRGSMEIWLEQVPHGVVVHYFLRADVPAEHRTPRALNRLRERRRVAFRERMWALKDEWEAADRAERRTPVVS